MEPSGPRGALGHGQLRAETRVDRNLTVDPQVRRFWSAYAKATRQKGTEFTAFGFGDNAELADELAALVIAGVKRAHTSLPRDLIAQDRPLPKPGDFAVIVDGGKAPCCIIRTLQVETRPMRDVDAQFAWETGGGDRSLEWWMSAHLRYFKRRAAREGFVFDESADVVLERFEVVWPREYADPKGRRGRERSKSDAPPG
jgi:uncharacterized protein YhfF